MTGRATIRAWPGSPSGCNDDGDATQDNSGRAQQNLNYFGTRKIALWDHKRRTWLDLQPGFVFLHLSVRRDKLHVGNRLRKAVPASRQRQVLLDAERRIVRVGAGCEHSALDKDVPALERHD